MSEKGQISGDTIVADIIDQHPQLKPLFVSFGFKKIVNPVMLRTVARHVTLSAACEMKKVDLLHFLEAIDKELGKESEA